MPSSTSSSDGSPRILACAALLVTLTVAGLEMGVRSLGFTPSVLDTKALWSEVRSDVYGPDKVVLIGGSRALFDISPDTFEALRPGLQVRQLGLGATWGEAILRDLADDEDFEGLVVASTRAEGLEPSHWDAQQDRVDYYHHEFRFDERLGSRLRTALGARLAVMSPAVSLPRLVERAIDERSLPKQWLVFKDDRSVQGNFAVRGKVADSMLESVVRGHYRRYAISSPDAWLAATAPVEAWIHAIQARGGRVALVRFPTSGVHWKVDEEHYPRALYWDRFAARTQAVAIHFLDDPVLSALELPDSTHIDRADAPRFTKRLVELLEERGFFDESGTRRESQK